MKKFDLEAAKSGAPIITRDGREARFIAHVPEAYEDSQLIWIDIQKKCITHSYANGKFWPHASENDLFMKPQKRTVWVSIYQSDIAPFGLQSFLYSTEHAAMQAAIDCQPRKPRAIAVPIEIEE